MRPITFWAGALSFFAIVLGASAGLAVAEKAEPTTSLAVPTLVSMPNLPRPTLLNAAEPTIGALFAQIDGAGIAGIDHLAGGPSPSNFIHLEDPLVCGAACLYPAANFGDEAIAGFCAPAPAWQWHWSSGVTSTSTCASWDTATFIVMSNGFVGPTAPGCGFSGQPACYTIPASIPATAGPNGQVYGLWQDLDNSCSLAPNGFYVALGGTAPERFVVFEWWNVARYPCSQSAPKVQFEIIIFESTNEVHVYYGSSAAATTSAPALGGQENNAGNAGLQFFRTTGAGIPQNASIAYFDAMAPKITSMQAGCASPGNAGWCRSSTPTLTVVDNNDVGNGGRVGFGVKSRTLSVNGGAPTNYTNNSAMALAVGEGVHNLTANATDWGLNSGLSWATLKIDATPPAFLARADELAEATGQNGAIVTYAAPTLSDSGSGPGPVSCAPASGSHFPMGQTTVTCTGSDVAGNGPVTTTFKVVVRDTRPPVIAPKADIFVDAESLNGAIVSYTAPPTFDDVDGPGVATCSPPSGALFFVGTTAVTCTATDAAGNSATPTQFAVHVTLRIRVAVAMDKPFYDAREALLGGVGGTIGVKTGAQTPVPDVQVSIRITRLAPGTGAPLDSVTIAGTTGPDGQFRFAVPIQYVLAGDYVVEGTSITPGLEGSSNASYSIGVGSLTMAGGHVAAPTRRAISF